MPPSEKAWYHASGMNARLLASSVIHNLGLHVTTPAPWINDKFSRAADSLHQALGVAPDDPRIVISGQGPAVPRFKVDEDLSGNPLHLALMTAGLVAGIVAVIRKKTRAPMESIALALTIVGGFLLFCANIKSERFDVRLHLPLFVLAGPLIGTLFGQMKHIKVLCGLLLIAGVPYVVTNPSHPLTGRRSIFRLPREQQYFENRMSLYEPYRTAVDILASKGSSNVGICGTGVWEYPLWIMMHNRSGLWPTIQTFAIPNDKEIARQQAILILDDVPATAQTLLAGWEQHRLGDHVTLAIAPNTHQQTQ